MPRKTALIGAAMLTGVMALAFIILTVSAARHANAAPAVVPTAGPSPEVPIQATIVNTAAEFEAALATREAALLDQLALREAAVAELDASYSAQLAELEGRLAMTSDAVLDAAQRVEALQSKMEVVGAEIAAADEVFQGEMTALQAGLAGEDAQIRHEIESIYAQLQVAYDQIAAQQAASVAQVDNGGGSDTGSSPSQPVDDHDDDDDGDDHDEDDDDDNDEGDDD
jgi:hypothetical protein